MYFIVDVGEEGPDGKAEGVLWFVREPKGEDVPRGSVGDDLVLDTVRVIGLSAVLRFHHSQLIDYQIIAPQHFRTQQPSNPARNSPKEGRSVGSILRQRKARSHSRGEYPVAAS